MDLWHLWSGIEMEVWLVGMIFVLVAAIGFIILAIKKVIRAFIDRFWPASPGKNYPKELVFTIGDGFTVVLDRVWFKGKWRYLLRGNLPYRFSSPEKDWLKNLDELTKPGGDYEETKDAYYKQPEQVARQGIMKRIFGNLQVVKK